MNYILKEDNAFYGIKGYIISSKLYHRLPSQHQLLFEEYNSNNKEFSDIIDKIKKVSNGINIIDNRIKRPAFDLNEVYIGDGLDGIEEEDDDDEY